MANALVTVTHPTKRTDNTPATVADLQSWRVLWKLKAATTFGPLGGARLPADTTASVQNITTGDYDFQVIWTDKDGQDSAPGIAVYTQTPPAKLSPGTVVVTPA